MLQFRNNFGNDDYDANDGHDHKNDSDKMLITVGLTIVGSPIGGLQFCSPSSGAVDIAVGAGIILLACDDILWDAVVQSLLPNTNVLKYDNDDANQDIDDSDDYDDNDGHSDNDGSEHMMKAMGKSKLGSPIGGVHFCNPSSGK